ncbi:sprouty-related, EVH1 domain-containing protein 1-like isoform X2 [Paramacrobiotus metropolitanus]|uniref:sprouty-related, EVH1 domain-containing protein 1-like isoform X2 n=1 Tax=Paramacrobiotus metropolitanus TaxID=2943436 RepID=UPI002445BCBC|nr:sprouty-related, EVH1 domain-containing protein 1-like isoform X2 [Paramacrobiotus metropolitanus]
MNEESLSSDTCLVRVRAQVMTRDDSTGGWVPVGGGGLSYVELRRIALLAGESTNVSDQPAKPKIEFLIIGRRITDNSVCLSCAFKRPIQYNQVTPTFRHWQIQNKKFGLTFQAQGDAKTFDVAVIGAIAELKELTPEPSPRSSRAYLSLDNSDTESVSVESDEPSRGSYNRQTYGFLGKPTIGERRSASPQLSSVSVPLPLRTTRSNQSAQMLSQPAAKRLLSLPANMTKSLSSPLHNATVPVQRETFALRNSTTLSPAASGSLSVRNAAQAPLLPYSNATPSTTSMEKYTYVDVISTKHDDRSSTATHSDPASGSTQSHDYHYPVVGGVQGQKPGKRDSLSSIKVHNLDMMASHRPPMLPIKSKRSRSKKRDNRSSGTNKYCRSERSRCKYCHEFYSLDNNERGACEFAPDRVKDGINQITCVPAAGRILCHCMRDPEGEGTHPCSCDSLGKSCFGRWLIVAALSLIMPCLCCYYPLKGCYELGLACGVCGGKHEPMDHR